jgi:hypothetical protein
VPEALVPEALVPEALVPEALVPVRCDTDHDHAVYVESNVWIEHNLIGS